MSRPSRTTGRHRAVAGVAIAATGLAGVAGAFGAGTSSASSHREAPLLVGNRPVDNTDVYAFVSPDDASKVTLIANWYPFQEPNGGPNFYFFDENARYDINIDSDGDARPNLTYRWTFDSQYKTKATFLYNTGVVTSLDDPDLNFTQTYTLERISYDAAGTPTATTLVTGGRVAPSNVGPASMPDYAALRSQAVTPAGTGGLTFAGQSDDPFFLDLRIFNLLYGGDFSLVGNDTLEGYNVQSIALQVPKSELALNGNATANPVIGVWSDTERQTTRVLAPTDSGRSASTPTMSGEFAQVSRLGNPLVNEAVIPLKDKDRFNHSTPQNDAQFLPYVTSPIVPRLVEQIYGIDAPATPRNDLVEVFLMGICTECGPVGQALDADLNSQRINADVAPANFAPSEQLRLNMSIPPTTTNPNRLGVLGGDLAGFPNGRRLADDVVDIELRALEGALPPYNRDLSTLGDEVDGNDRPFGATFPYLPLPHDESVNKQ